MASKDAIINDCLTLLGEPRVTSPLTDGSSWVVKIRDAYVDCTRSLLEDHDWSFAMKMVNSTTPEPTPPLDWPYAHKKQPDWMRTVTVDRVARIPLRPGSSRYEFEDRGNLILAGHASIYVWYISSDLIDREGAWPQKFADLLSAEVANRVCPVTDESSLTIQRIDAALLRRRKDAKVFNGTNQDAGQKRAPGRWARARSWGSKRGMNYDDWSN